jgi:pyrroline-5-carboxylate reductase
LWKSAVNVVSLLIQLLGAQTSNDNQLVVQQTDVVFLTVKPENVPDVLCNIRPHICRRHLLLSTAMGVTIQDIEKVRFQSC